jgi:hypothetical protein
MQKCFQYSLYQFIEIRFADPVTSIGLGEKYIVVGTIMGRISAFSIVDKQSVLISEISNENITGIVFDNPDTFTVSIGDEEYLKYRLNCYENGQIVTDFMRFKIYESDIAHKNFCDSSFTFAYLQNLIVVNLIMPNETNLHIEPTTTNIRVRIFLNHKDEKHTHQRIYRVCS